MGFNAAGFSSDGRRLLVGTVLCEPVTGRKVAELGNYLSQGSSFERFEFSLDGLVVALSANNQSTIVDATNGSRSVPFLHPVCYSTHSVPTLQRSVAMPSAFMTALQESQRPLSRAAKYGLLPVLRSAPTVASSWSIIQIPRCLESTAILRVSVHERLTGRLLVSISGLEWPVDFSPDGSVAIFVPCFQHGQLARILPSGGRRFPSVLRFRASLGRFLKTGNLIWDEPTELKLASHASEKPRLTGMHDGLGPVHSISAWDRIRDFGATRRHDRTQWPLFMDRPSQPNRLDRQRYVRERS